MSPMPDSTLANPQGVIAELRRELAEMRRRLDEALAERDEGEAQKAAIAEVLKVINSSPDDLAPVFDAILHSAMRLCDASYGHFRILDGESLLPVAIRGASELVEQLEPRSAHAALPSGRILAGERIVHILDLKEVYLQGHAELQALVETGGARTVLTVALRKEDILLGSLTLYRREVRLFSERHIALVENFASQAVIAMENARLLTETREALDQQTATTEVLQVINASPGNLGPVFAAMMDKTKHLTQSDFSSFMTYDGSVFHMFTEEWGTEILIPERGDALTELLDGAPFVHIRDVVDTDAYRARLPSRVRLVEGAGARTSLWVSLRKDGSLLGALTAYRREVRPFSDREIDLLRNFAAQAVIAMENARLLGELRQRTEEVAELNRGLETRVAEQLEELGRVGRLKRFLAPQLAELIVSQGNEKILESHRREIVVVFCDLRGYTAFTETAEPEEVLDFLRDYHGALGPLVAQFEGTLDQFSGDGIMVFFNDPVPIPEPAARAVNMAVAMREAASRLIADWRERGRDLGFGAGIAQGYATLGQIGFSERSGYTAIGTVCNVAARLCAEAKDGQILLSQRVNAALRGSVVTEQVGALALKGLTQPIVAYNVSLVGGQAAFPVIEGGPPSA